jgi:anti-anti-sigma factor
MSDEIVVIAPGEIDIATCPGFLDALRDAIREAPARIAVDMTNVTFLDSSGMNALVQAKHLATEAGVGLAIISPNGLVRKAMTIGRLDEVVDIRD